MAFRKTVDPNCVALVKFTPDEEGNIKNFPTDENANGVGFQCKIFAEKKPNLRLLWNLRKFVHLSTTSVSSIMSADIKISCRQSFQIFYNENEKPERFLGKARRGRCIWSQPETEEFAGKFPADKKKSSNPEQGSKILEFRWLCRKPFFPSKCDSLQCSG